MPRNALNFLNIENGFRKAPNFDMNHVMGYLECTNFFKANGEASVASPLNPHFSELKY